MLKIGEFSRLSQVTVKTLRYYDDIGLLKPETIDPFTGYRYYSVDQLARLHRIMALKELGLSLEQIAATLNDNLSTQELHGMLRIKQAEIQQHVREEQARLAQVAFRLRMIEMEEQMPELDVIVKQIPPVRALTLRASLTQENLLGSLLATQAEIERAFAQRRIRFAGPAMEIHYSEEFRLFQDAEIVLPVGDDIVEDVPLETAGILTLKTVPGLAMAATYIRRGVDGTGRETETLAQTWPVLQRWIVGNGYRLCNTHRLVHHRGPFEHAEYADWVTEFQHEIALQE